MIEKIRLPSSAATTVCAIGEKMRPSTRCSRKIGRYAAMMMSSANTVGRATAVTARRIRSVAVWGGVPGGSASEVTMYSTMTTAPSTMMPKSTAPIDSRLADMPRQPR